MKIINNFLACLILCLNLSANVNGQNCTLVNGILEDGKKINALQLSIDEIVYRNGMVSTLADDPTFITFGEYAIDPIFVQQMYESQSLLNTIRLWKEQNPNSTDGLLSCISKDERCPKRPAYTCGRERSLDGTCNNGQNPTMGASFTTYYRKSPPYFEDGIDTIRRSKFSKSELPLPRIISNEIFAEQEKRAATSTANLLQSIESKNICNGTPVYAKPIRYPWRNQPKRYLFNFNGYMFGQEIALDTANRIITKNPDRTNPGYQCCNNPNQKQDGMANQVSNRACLPIIYPATDPFFSQFNATCGNFVRGATLHPPSCRMHYAEFGNGPTAFLDLSGVYGVDKATCDSLRAGTGGQMVTNAYNVLPLEENCTISACYRAGDYRINQSPPLAQWTSIFYRNHNFICKSLAEQNPTWNDDRLFEECRRLNIAIYQHIVFNEYLPLLLKEDFTKKYGIRCDRTNSLTCDNYQRDTNPSIILEFTQAAGRGLHVCLPDYIYVRRTDGKVVNEYAFSDVLGVTDILDHQYDGLIRGALCQPIYCTNISYSNEIRNRMFKINGMGFDLFSVDINRARDNGLPPYHVLYTYCTGKTVSDWSDLSEHFEPANLNLMASIYESAFDMDVLPGVLMETRGFNLLGVVASCMTAEQFHNLKFGDRYFYSFTSSPTKFTNAQINEIERMSIAKLLSQVTDLKSVPQHAFLVESKSNPNILCRNYRDFNYSLWKEI